MALVLFALGTSIQVPVIESITHDQHHTRSELYAFFAEIEECNEEDRSELAAFGSSEGVDFISIFKKCLSQSLCSAHSEQGKIEYQAHSFLTPLNRKIYLLIGRLSAQLPKSYTHMA
jgi:hypothetical protein